MDDMNVSINEMLEAAMEADKKGVPVDWQAMCFQVYNVATNYIAKLEWNLQEKDTKTPSEG